MRKLLTLLVLLALAGGAAFWFVSAPGQADPGIATGAPDMDNGRLVFFAGGCASCHAMPGQPDKLLLGGGLRLESPFGSFAAPNISPHPERGIGGWTPEQFATAVRHGVSPQGRHYYPAFPYAAYQHTDAQDLRDLHAFIATLASSDKANENHDFPFELAPARRAVGLWKRLNLPPAPLPPAEGQSPEWMRGRYLVEALGHCAECHSPRDVSGGIIASRRMSGAVMPNGDRAPDITSKGLGDWAEEDLVFFLEDGTTPEGDVAGGEMALVIANTSQLLQQDRAAIAAYLKSLPPGE